MKFCKNCGAQLEDAAKFCPTCGTASAGAAQQPQNAAPYQPQNNANAYQQAPPPPPPNQQQYRQPMQNNPYQQQPLNQQYRTYQPPHQNTSGKMNVFAIIGFLGSLLAGVAFFYIGYSIEIAAVALVLSIIGAVQARRRYQKGRGLAKLGIFFSIVVIVGTIAYIAYWMYIYANWY